MISSLLRGCGLAALSLILAGGAAFGDEPKVGDAAPDFTLKGSDGKTYSLADFKGKQAVVIAWFPKAFTGGCTAECKSFRANSATLKGTNVAYFTASTDDQKTNADFAKSLDLDYPILCDPDRKVGMAYGVVAAPTGYAKRWTFYIDKDGVIKGIDKMIKTGKAGEDCVAKLKELGIVN